MIFLDPSVYKFAMWNYKALNIGIGSFGSALIVQSFITTKGNGGLAFGVGALFCVTATVMYWVIRPRHQKKE